MPGKAKEYWIEKLGLQPHPKEEKGFFRETHRLVQPMAKNYVENFVNPKGLVPRNVFDLKLVT